MNLGNFFVFTLLALGFLSVFASKVLQKRSNLLAALAFLHFLIVLGVTAVSFFISFSIAFGSCFKKECSEVINFLPLWLPGVIFIISVVISWNDLYKKADHSISTLLKDVVVPGLILLSGALSIGAIAGVLTA